MTAIFTPPRPPTKCIPQLQSGDRLNSTEFLRRYEAMPSLKKAELIEGVVYVMSSPVRYEAHTKPDGTMHGIMGFYAISTPGVVFGPNGTVELDSENTFQPDGFLRKLPEKGGQTHIDDRDYVIGAPELIVEIAASSASIDLGKKRDVYLKHRVPEYICWLTESDAGFKWWFLVNGQYVELLPDADGITRSRTFPGFWLDIAAILSDNKARIRETMELGLASAEHGAF